MASAEDQKKMPLLDHLIELRRRLLYSVVGLIIAFGICFYFAQDIFFFLAQPLADILGPDHRFIYTELTEVFFTFILLGSALVVLLQGPDPVLSLLWCCGVFLLWMISQSYLVAVRYSAIDIMRRNVGG